MKEKKYYTVDEVSEILGCSSRIVYEMVSTGRLKAFRLGTGKKHSRIRIPRDALDTNGEVRK